MLPSQENGLSLDQAPPLRIPLLFFSVAPIALLAAGTLLLFREGSAHLSRMDPVSFAVAHCLALGFLGSVMMGALYQMTPVVAGKRVPWIWIAYLVLPLFVGGVVFLVLGFLGVMNGGFTVAHHLMGYVFVLFVVPTGIALFRAPTRSDTVWGMRLAVLAFALALSAGIVLAIARTGRSLYFNDNWFSWVYTHLGLGLVAWIGGLLTSVSWQVVPMFYLSGECPGWARKSMLLGQAFTMVAPLLALFAGAGPGTIALLCLPGAVSVFLLHPWTTALMIRSRLRKRREASLSFWGFGLAAGPLVLLLGLLATTSADTRYPLLLGWTLLFGWAGMIVHGMLTRIVPFLLWFHRFSSLVGKPGVPTLRDIYPERRGRVGLYLHQGAYGLGVLAILLESAPLYRGLGLLLSLTGLWLGVSLLRAVRLRAETSLPSPQSKLV